jgi:hypothetical protein
VVWRGNALGCIAPAEDFIRCSTFTLGPEDVCLRVDKGFGFFIQRSDLFYAPRELALSRGLSHELTSPCVTDKKQDAQQTDWEDEGGSAAPEPTQRTPKGLEIPVPKRREVMDALRKIVKPKPAKG